MPDIVSYTPTSLASSWGQRSKARELSRVKTATDLSAARHSAEIAVVESVTESALLATAHVSALEAYLFDRVPHAENRLRHVADGGCIAMANIVTKLASS